jgi:hypothetical protein
VFITDQPDPDAARLELRHRRRARVEDRIRCGKASGLRNLPFDLWRRNQVWLELVLAAQDLLCWAQVLLLDGDLKVAEPKTLRYRLLHQAHLWAVGGDPPPAPANSSSAPATSRSLPPIPVDHRLSGWRAASMKLQATGTMVPHRDACTCGRVRLDQRRSIDRRDQPAARVVLYRQLIQARQNIQIVFDSSTTR